MHRTTVRWTENEYLPLDLPEHWHILGHYAPRVAPPIADLSSQLTQRLEKPLGQAGLSALLAQAKRVALVIDDLTRPTPVTTLLEPVVTALEKAGIADNQITGIVATGMHPHLSAQELTGKVGPGLAQKFKWVQNHCRNLARYAYLGKIGDSPGGDLDVYVLKELDQADLIILFSSVTPHLQAGFGGGSKLLFPGCAHVRTIGPLHRIGLGGDVSKLVGQPPARNHMRRAVEQAVVLLGSKVFSVSTLLDSAASVSSLELGEPTQVQQRLSSACEHIFGLDITEQSDVVIVSAFPRDYDILQSFKSIANVRMAAKEGAIVVGMMNLSTVGHLRVKVPFTVPTSWLQSFLRLIDGPVATRLLLPLDKGLGPEATFFARLGLDAIRRNRVMLYCPQLINSGVRFPYIEVFAELPPLWQRVEKLLGKPDRVRANVFAEGGSTYLRSTS
jgi:nickel-dependent lactate racemase